MSSHWGDIISAIENTNGFKEWREEDNGLHEWLVAVYEDGDEIRIWMWRNDE